MLPILLPYLLHFLLYLLPFTFLLNIVYVLPVFPACSPSSLLIDFIHSFVRFYLLPFLLLSCFLSSFPPLFHLCLLLPSRCTCSFLFFSSFLLPSLLPSFSPSSTLPSLFPSYSRPCFPTLCLFCFYLLPTLLAFPVIYLPSLHPSLLPPPSPLSLFVYLYQCWATINRIQNKSLWLHNICVLFYIYII